MAKFCNKCGSPLEDGKCPNCEDTKVEKEEIEEVEEQDEEREETQSEILEQLKDIFKNVWKNPIQTIKKYKEDASLAVAFIIMAITIVIGGIFTYFYLGSLIKGIINDVQNWAMPIAMLTGEDMETVNTDLLVLPFFRLFMYGVVIAVISYGLFTLLSKLFVGIIFKGEGTLKEYFTTISIASIFPTAFSLIAILLGFMSYKLATLVFIAGLVVFIVITVQGFIEALKANENRLAISVPLAVILTFILEFIIIIILFAILTINSTSMYY